MKNTDNVNANIKIYQIDFFQTIYKNPKISNVISILLENCGTKYNVNSILI